MAETHYACKPFEPDLVHSSVGKQLNSTLNECNYVENSRFPIMEGGCFLFHRNPIIHAPAIPVRRIRSDIELNSIS